MQAVISSGSKQYIVEPGQTLEIDLLSDDLKTIELEPLLIIDGDKITVGTPTVAGVMVKADVIEMVKGEKIKVLKFKAKKRIKTQTGHRQRYTQIKIASIGTAKAAKPAAKVAKKEPAAAAK